MADESDGDLKQWRFQYDFDQLKKDQSELVCEVALEYLRSKPYEQIPYRNDDVDD